MSLVFRKKEKNLGRSDKICCWSYFLFFTDICVQFNAIRYVHFSNKMLGRRREAARRSVSLKILLRFIV